VVRILGIVTSVLQLVAINDFADILNDESASKNENKLLGLKSGQTLEFLPMLSLRDLFLSS
jgi:hypothetical protein